MSNVALGLILVIGILLCAWFGYVAVAETRNIVTPGLGFRVGAMMGLGVAAFVFIMGLIVLELPRSGSAMRDSRSGVTAFALSEMGLGVIAAGIAGSIAVLRKPNPWHRQGMGVAPQTLAPGSQHPFTWYFEGHSTVPVTSLDEICEWLQTCEYISDVDQFHTVDYWQQPVAFEHTRRGDCEDHALWAWRKLIELGYAAEFMLGTSHRYQAKGEYHAWVTFQREGKRYLLEATYKHFQMIVPLEEVQYLYHPTYGVDEKLQMYQYNKRR